MKRKYLKQDVGKEDLTEAQEKIIEIAIEKPELTHQEIADQTEWSQSHVSGVHQDYLEEEIIADEIETDNLTDDLYEIIVAGMEATEEVDKVERHYHLDLSRGDSKEVDVAVWITQGGHQFLVIIECKLHERAVDQDVPAAMAWYRDNSSANKAMIIARNGFQSGAKALAGDAEMELYRLDELTRDVGESQMMKFNINLEIRPTQAEVTDIGVEPLPNEDYDGGQMQVNVTSSDALFDENKNPTGKNLHQRIQEAIYDKSPGTYTENIDNRLLLLNDHFFRLTEIEYKVERLDPAELEFEMDAYEEYDLYMEDVLEEGDTDIDLISIEEAITAFEEDVR